MNPPSTEDDDNGYLGSEPLDTALADRFAFVVEMPSWNALNEAEQLEIISAEDLTPTADDCNLHPLDAGQTRGEARNHRATFRNRSRFFFDHTALDWQLIQ